ncbi:Rieske [2Fe-2S] iron-sulfur domain-containing protein [Aspergillus pseudoustus]|uniref:Choline monooxygenase, chloroplastic n=1 Tax=Aspergillus pseudoustus TaxID=1810923 RepID=A0ABR4IKQ1_9EURO
MLRNLSNKLFSGEATAPDAKSDTHALPSSWYRTPALFNLERRALFSKKWLLVTHRMRITEPGDYLSFEIAGFPFLLCIDRQGVLRGFHNVCRHRAFPVVGNESGKANILACKYHGWSYGLNGNLAKAPKYETIPDFDKEKNGLFPIHIHVDKRGFIWVNLEAGERPSVPWSADFLGADEQERLDDFKMNEYSFDHAWTMNGEFNWKTLLDNYNECYHCSVAHPGIAAVSNLSTYTVEVQGGYIQHFVEDKPGYDSQMKVAPTFLFPNVTVTMTTHYFYLMRVNPTSATTTILQYEVYRHKDAPTEVFDELDVFFKQVEGEDKQLCEGAQRNLNAGVYVNGVLHPSTEKGVLYFQTLVRSALLKHHEAEEAGGRDIWPSVNKIQEVTKTRSELDFCAKLDCGADAGLAW